MFGWFFYSLLGVIFDEIWGMIKITTPYQLPEYKTLELVVESEPISSSNNYDPTSILESSNPLPTSRAATIPCSGIKYGCGCGYG
jgi:hypothetical protein